MSVDSAYHQDTTVLPTDLLSLLDKQRQAYAAHPYPPQRRRNVPARQRPRPVSASGRDRDHSPVELPAVSSDGPLDRCVGGGQPGDAQTQ